MSDVAGNEQQAGYNPMQELSKERRRRAFIGMLKLLEHGAGDATQLTELTAPMSDEELLQVAEERALAGKCGNPLCKKPFTWEEPRQRYRATTASIHKVEGDSYCSKACRSFILQLSSQLVNPLDRIQPQSLHNLAQPSHRSKHGVAAQGGGVPTMKSVIQERDPVQLAVEAEQAGSQLDEAAVQQQQVRADTAAVVEGFRPRAPHSRHQQQKQQHDDQQQEGFTDRNTGAAPSSDKAPQPSIIGDVAVSSRHVYSSPTDVCDSDQEWQAETNLQPRRQRQQQQQQQLDAHVLDLQGAHTQTSDSAPAQSNPTAGSRFTSAAALTGGLVDATVTSRSISPDAAADSQPSHRKRHVTFAPVVEYSCPAEPQAPPEQPVLTFTVHDPSSPLDLNSSSNGGGGGGGGLMGELRVTSAVGLESHQAADSGDTDQGDGSAGSSSDPAGATELPEAWRLFFPPALGGVGVPVKQLVQTRPLQKTRGHEQQSKEQHQQQLQQSSQNLPTQQKKHEQQQLCAPTVSIVQSAAPMNASNGFGGSGLTAAPSATSVPASGSTSTRLVARSSRPQPSNSIEGSTSKMPEAMTSDYQQSAAAPAAAVGANPGGAVTNRVSVAPGPRKFSPIVRPRRSVVVLDAAPDVVVRQRGLLPKSLTASESAAEDRVQQQHPSHTNNTTTAAVSQQDSRSAQKPVTAEAAAAAAATVGDETLPVGQNDSTMTLPPADSSSVESDTSDDVSECGHISADNSCGGHQQASSSNNSRSVVDTQSRPVVAKHQPISRPISSDDSGSDSEDSAYGDFVGQVWRDSDDGDDPTDDEVDEHDHEFTDGGGEAGGSDITTQLQGALQSLCSFLDTKGVTVHLSEFGLLWNTLHAWVTPTTQAYVNNKQAAAVAISAAIDSAVAAAGGKQVVVAQADAANIPSAEPVPSMFVLQQRTALANMLAPALPLVIEQLSIKVPQAELTRHLHALVRSFYMSGPLPPFQLHHWQMVVALMLAALSAWRVPSMRQLFSRRQPPHGKLEQMLFKLGTDIDRFMALLDLFELDV